MSSVLARTPEIVENVNSRHCTRLLRASMDGNAQSARDLAALTYEDLRGQARRMLGHAAGAIDATAIVHDAFLRLIDQRKQNWRSRSHFAAIGSTVLRRVLIDALRARGRRRDHQTRISAAGDVAGDDAVDVDLLDLDEALQELARVDPQAARIVEMRFFGGLTVREIAEELRLPPSSVHDIWTFARTWLGRRLRERG